MYESRMTAPFLAFTVYPWAPLFTPGWGQASVGISAKSYDLNWPDGASAGSLGLLGLDPEDFESFFFSVLCFLLALESPLESFLDMSATFGSRARFIPFASDVWSEIPYTLRSYFNILQTFKYLFQTIYQSQKVENIV